MEMVSTSYFDSGKALVALEAARPQTDRSGSAQHPAREVPSGPVRRARRRRRTPPAAAEARGVAQRLAAESLVLLKNDDHALPLAKDDRARSGDRSPGE